MGCEPIKSEKQGFCFPFSQYKSPERLNHVPPMALYMFVEFERFQVRLVHRFSRTHAVRLPVRTGDKAAGITGDA